MTEITIITVETRERNENADSRIVTLTFLTKRRLIGWQTKL